MRQLETLRHRWEGNIITDLKKGNIITDLKKGIDWNHLALHRDRGLALVNMAVGFFFYFNQQMHTIVITFTVTFFKHQSPTLFGRY